MPSANVETNITGSVSVVKDQQCKINIVFSNNVGSSEPYELEFSKCFII